MGGEVPARSPVVRQELLIVHWESFVEPNPQTATIPTPAYYAPKAPKRKASAKPEVSDDYVFDIRGHIYLYLHL
ncbi:hypothetical protein LIHA111178_05355 [Litorimonas haliclonae]